MHAGSDERLDISAGTGSVHYCRAVRELNEMWGRIKTEE